MYSKVNLELSNLRHTYTIDTDGIVRNETNGKVLKGTSINRNNRYVKIHLDKFYPLHRLVANHFIPNPDNLPQVNHINGNRNDNRVINLEWVTPSDNVSHAFSTGLKQPQHGESCGTSILKEADVRRIWALRHSSLTARQIRDKYNLPVSIDAVKLVRRGKTWKSLTSTLD